LRYRSPPKSVHRGKGIGDELRRRGTLRSGIPQEPLRIIVLGALLLRTRPRAGSQRTGRERGDQLRDLNGQGRSGRRAVT
jgi:hypothetical protein